MYDGHRIGVVIPVYNEASFIGEVIDELPVFVDRAYPVDDCSTDGTWEVIEQRLSANQPVQEPDIDQGASIQKTMTDGSYPPETKISPIRHETNRGRGGAVKTGYRAALEDDMDVIAVMDGDGQMDPDRLDALIDPIVDGVADYAKGNRLGTHELRKEMPTWRLFGNSVLTVLTRIASGYWGMTDPQSGYTAISRESLELLDIDALYDRYGFLNDMLVRLNAIDVRIVDVPVSAIYGDEESGIRYHSFVPFLSCLLMHRFIWRLRTKYGGPDLHPVMMFYALAAVIGLGGFAYTLGSVVTTQISSTTIPLVLIIVCVALVGTACLLDRHYNRELEFDLDSDFSLDEGT